MSSSEDRPSVLIQPRQATTLARSREDAFNEVIYGLDILHRMFLATGSDGLHRGVNHALEYVKAMKEMEP